MKVIYYFLIYFVLISSGYYYSIWAQNSLLSGPCEGEIKIDTTYFVQINKELPIYKLHLILYDDNCYNIYIFKDNKTDTLQVINYGFLGSFHLDDDFEIIDANFDGYSDLQIFEMSGNTTNKMYVFWLFDPQTGLFEFSDKYSNSIGTNSYIDSRNKEIRTGGFTGCAGGCFHFDTYRIINGKRVLIKREYQELAENQPEGNNLTIYVRTLEELVHGKMVITKQITGSFAEIEDQWDDN